MSSHLKRNALHNNGMHPTADTKDFMLRDRLRAAGDARVRLLRIEMGKHFSVGDRVIVSEDFTWARGALGTVALPPSEVSQFFGESRGAYREVRVPKGVVTFYWVKFDQPYLDADGDGPYAEAEIASKYLIPADE